MPERETESAFPGAPESACLPTYHPLNHPSLLKILFKTFHWIDGTRWDFRYWAPGHPANGSGRCVYMTSRGEWGWAPGQGKGWQGGLPHIRAFELPEHTSTNPCPSFTWRNNVLFVRRAEMSGCLRAKSGDGVPWAGASWGTELGLGPGDSFPSLEMMVTKE